MRPASRQTTFERILVFLDVTSDHLPALESAAELAARLRIPLVAVFVDHGDLVALEDHPLVRAIDLPTGRGMAMRQGSMHRQWRALARRTRRRLARLARRYRLEADFQTLRGDVSEQFAQMGSTSDLVVVESAGRTVTRHTRVESRGHAIARNLPAPVVFVGSAPRRFRSVVLIYDGSPTSERGLDTALELAGGGASLLSLVWVGDSDEETRALQSRVQRRLSRQRRRIPVHSRRISCHDTDAIKTICMQMHANFTIIPACDTYPCGSDIDRLSRELDCPVLVLRSQFGGERGDAEFSELESPAKD